MNSLTTRIIKSDSIDPWYNLALEEALLEDVKKGEAILYLWQNKDTVVIGRNQNPWKECDHKKLENAGGKMARRLSGGGAVFHDMGNLNFTFITDRKIFDIQRQLSVILEAVKSLGINACFSGRNDILAEDRKFSGNAYYYRDNKAYHHGTILIDSDFERLGRYLTVSPEKIAAKGVDSVRSRVVNLKSLNSSLTIDAVSQQLERSFAAEYASVPVVCHPSDFDISDLYLKYSSWEWIYGEAPKFDISLEKRFPWGGVDFCMTLLNGKVSSVKVYSDSLNVYLFSRIEEALRGCEFKLDVLADSLAAIPLDDAEEDMIADIQEWLLEKSSTV